MLVLAGERARAWTVVVVRPRKMPSLSSDVRSIVSTSTIGWVERFGREVEGSKRAVGVKSSVAIEESRVQNSSAFF